MEINCRVRDSCSLLENNINNITGNIACRDVKGVVGLKGNSTCKVSYTTLSKHIIVSCSSIELSKRTIELKGCRCSCHRVEVRYITEECISSVVVSCNLCVINLYSLVLIHCVSLAILVLRPKYEVILHTLEHLELNSKLTRGGSRGCAAEICEQVTILSIIDIVDKLVHIVTIAIDGTGINARKGSGKGNKHLITIRDRGCNILLCTRCHAEQYSNRHQK